MRKWTLSIATAKTERKRSARGAQHQVVVRWLRWETWRHSTSQRRRRHVRVTAKRLAELRRTIARQRRTASTTSSLVRRYVPVRLLHRRLPPAERRKSPMSPSRRSVDWRLLSVCRQQLRRRQCTGLLLLLLLLAFSRRHSVGTNEVAPTLRRYRNTSYYSNGSGRPHLSPTKFLAETDGIWTLKSPTSWYHHGCFTDSAVWDVWDCFGWVYVLTNNEVACSSA